MITGAVATLEGDDAWFTLFVAPSDFCDDARHAFLELQDVEFLEIFKKLPIGLDFRFGVQLGVVPPGFDPRAHRVDLVKH